MSKEVLGNLEHLLAETSESGFTPEIEQAFLDGLPGVFARVRGLEEALEPFARVANNVPERWPDDATCELSTECGPSDIPENCERARLIISMDGISVADIRRARAALTLKETDCG